MSIQEQTFRGLSWNLIGRSGRQFIRLLSDVILARLLSPDDFGTVGVAIAVVHLCKLPASFGIATTIVQLREKRQQTLSTAFFFNILVGLLLFVLVHSFVGPLTEWYGKPSLEPATRWASFIIPLYALNIVQGSLYRKAINFKKLATIGIAAELAGVLTGVAAVLSGWGLMALVAKHLVAELIYTCLLWWRSTWFPQAHFELRELQKLLSVGVFVFLAQSSDVILTRLSTLTIGAVFGTTTLGLMNKASSLSSLVTNYVSNSFKEVSFSSLSTLADEKRFGNALADILNAVYFLAFGLAGFLFFAGADIVYVVLGEQWDKAVPIFHVLVLISPIMASDGVLSFAFVARGKSRKYFRFDLLKKLLTVIPITLAFFVSFEEFLMLLAISAALKLLFNQTVIAGQLGISSKDRATTVVPYLIATILCGAASYLSTASIEFGLFSHLTKGVVFAALYAMINGLFRTRGWVMFTGVTNSIIGKVIDRS